RPMLGDRAELAIGDLGNFPDAVGQGLVGLLACIDDLPDLFRIAHGSHPLCGAILDRPYRLGQGLPLHLASHGWYARPSFDRLRTMSSAWEWASVRGAVESQQLDSSWESREAWDGVVLDRLLPGAGSRVRKHLRQARAAGGPCAAQDLACRGGA